MSEGRVYLCDWTLDENGYKFWVRKRPHVQAVAASLEEAQEALFDSVCLQLGDGEPVFQFDPPLPSDARAARYLSPRIFRIVGNISPDHCTPIEELYSGGSCAECGEAVGPRNSQKLWVDYLESGFEGGFAHVNIVFYSESFLSLFRQEEIAGMEFRPIQRRQKRGRKRFYELIAHPDVTFVGAPGLEPKGWQCSSCGYRQIGYEEDWLPFFDFVCREDLPIPARSCFTVGDGRYCQLAMSQQRWREIAERPATKGLVASPIGVLSGQECIRSPSLPLYKDIAKRQAST